MATKKKVSKKKVKKAASPKRTKKPVKKVLKAKPKPKAKEVSSRKTSSKKKTSPRRKVSKKASKAPLRRTASPKAIGVVTHFYTDIKVAVVKFSKPVKQGTSVRFMGATTDFSQKLDSMQYDHKALSKAPKGKQVGVKVKARVRQGDKIYP